MTYEEFKKEYTTNFNKMNKYKIDEVGSQFFAEKLACLSDAFPEYEEALLEESFLLATK